MEIEIEAEAQAEVGVEVLVEDWVGACFGGFWGLMTVVGLAGACADLKGLILARLN